MKPEKHFSEMVKSRRGGKCGFFFCLCCQRCLLIPFGEVYSGKVVCPPFMYEGVYLGHQAGAKRGNINEAAEIDTEAY